MGPETTKFARIDPGPSHAFNFVASAIADVGFVLVLVSFLGLDWFLGGTQDRPADFGGVHDLLDSAGGSARGLASAYFSWLAWGLLAVTFLCALAALVPTVGRPFRVLAPVVAAASVLVTFLSIDLLHADGLSYGDYFDEVTIGFWLTVVGFVLMGAAAVIGPRRTAR